MNKAVFDPLVADEYVNHLSRVNKTNKVIAQEDIRNEQGVLLIKKGAEIDERLAQKVIKHKLNAPLDQSVNLANVLDTGRLYKLFHKLFERYPDCLDLHQALNLDPKLKEQCFVYNHHPVLSQKLTVQSMRRPRDFEKSLFCGWFALGVAFSLRLSAEQQTAAFLAGLMHDIGMLHISAEVLDKKGELTAEEWRAIQSHPLVGELVLKEVKGLPKEVGRAVAEHHERTDGTGYPAGRFADKLDILGQIVALADVACGIRLMRFGSSGRSLRDLVPILQFNGKLYLPEAWRAVMNVLRLLPPRDGVIESAEKMPVFLLDQLHLHQRLRKSFDYVASVVPWLPEQSSQRPVRTAAVQVHNINDSVVSSGLLSSSLGEWISSVYKEKEIESYTQMEEIALMQQEVQWQLRQLKKSLRVLGELERNAGFDKPAEVNRLLAILDGLDS